MELPSLATSLAWARLTANRIAIRKKKNHIVLSFVACQSSDKPWVESFAPKPQLIIRYYKLRQRANWVPCIQSFSNFVNYFVIVQYLHDTFRFSFYTMQMPYTMNPHIAKVRAKAVQLVKQTGWSVRQVAEHVGVHRATVYDWIAKTPPNAMVVHAIPTHSSRPKHHPRAVDRKIVNRIREIRLEHGRCAEAIWYQLQREGVVVSLSTVKRTLARQGLLRTRSPWKQIHQSGVRPAVSAPGTLVEMDSIHFWSTPPRVYLSTVIDVYSRYAYVTRVPALRPGCSVNTVLAAQQAFPFTLQCVQTDHGSEFGKYFSVQLHRQQIRHRQIRIRTPNDNAHVERFNRSLQEECGRDLRKYLTKPAWFTRTLREYLVYYNTERIHLGLEGKIPQELLTAVS